MGQMLYALSYHAGWSRKGTTAAQGMKQEHQMQSRSTDLHSDSGRYPLYNRGKSGHAPEP